MQMHALLSIFCSRLAVVSSLKPSFFLRLDNLKVLGPVFDIVEPFFLDPLRLCLASAAAKAGAPPIAVKIEAALPGTIDVPGELVGDLPAIGAAIFHDASPALVMRWESEKGSAPGSTQT